MASSASYSATARLRTLERVCLTCRPSSLVDFTRLLYNATFMPFGTRSGKRLSVEDPVKTTAVERASTRCRHLRPAQSGIVLAPHCGAASSGAIGDEAG